MARWAPPDASMTVREALRDAMAEEMRRDEKRFRDGRGSRRIPGRLQGQPGPAAGVRAASASIDTPITEHGFAGIGVGAAMGLKPIVEFMTFNFAMQAIDHIINSAAKTLYMSGGQMGCVHRVPRTERCARASARSTARITPPGIRNIPGLKVVAPFSAADAKGLLKAAIRDPNPVIFLETKSLRPVGDVPRLDDFVLPIGKARIGAKGEDVTIVSLVDRHDLCAEGRRRTAGRGRHRRRVIDLRTIRPMDTETVVASVKKTGRCVTVEEGWPQSGVGRDRGARHDGGLRLSRCAGRARHRQRTCRCPTPPTSKTGAAERRRGRRGGQSRPIPVIPWQMNPRTRLRRRTPAKGGHEVLRCFVVDGLSSFIAPFVRRAGTWGVLLADLARHAARIYALETQGPRKKRIHRGHVRRRMVAPDRFRRRRHAMN